MLPKFLDDPAPELRFEAVKAEFEKHKALPKTMRLPKKT